MIIVELDTSRPYLVYLKENLLVLSRMPLFGGTLRRIIFPVPSQRPASPSPPCCSSDSALWLTMCAL